ncbi:hypothetical protein GQ44DRAFT_338213 [Phaeosphaeriaceae sp. PMI808]|nr:hypothetical protein GQ44DRAFT_338213 [Phaeosphaeriaceae sp. PMI808]
MESTYLGRHAEAEEQLKHGIESFISEKKTMAGVKKEGDYLISEHASEVAESETNVLERLTATMTEIDLSKLSGTEYAKEAEPELEHGRERERPNPDRTESKQHTEDGGHSIYDLYPIDAAKKEIRLLEIISLVGREKEAKAAESLELKIRFHVVSLLEDPDYCALSYVWGSSTTTKPVTIELEDGAEAVVPVT